ncbi:MAG: hypothetical protein ACYTFG_19265, partial [Planctomycetota bacterium]
MGLSRNDARHGFALMDLMVSVLILGLFLVPLAMSRNNVIQMVGRTVSLRKARVLAAQRLGELELEKVEELVDTSGDFGDENPGFRWEMRVETIPLDEVVDLAAAVDEGEEDLPVLEDEDAEEQIYEVVRVTLVVFVPD